MDELFAKTLVILDATFERLAAQIPEPQLVSRNGALVFRCKEKTVQQALVLKLARMISSLRAAHLLLGNGFVQEQATIQRVLDEIGEDILFLVMSITEDDFSDLHKRYLAEFYQEEFDEGKTALASAQKRDRVPRRKIRAYIAMTEAKKLQRAGKRADPNGELEAANTIGKAYSGYVHAAAVFVLDLYGGDPPSFHLNGMLGTPRIHEHTIDLINYFYRSLVAIGCVSHAFNDRTSFDAARQCMKSYEASYKLF